MLYFDKIYAYVEEHITEFHDNRIKKLKRLNLKTILKRKNPYLFKVKNLLTAEQIVRALTDAYLSSQEETLFGEWLEGLAIFINQEVYQGWKSGIPGIDLEFNKDKIRYIVSIKSGPNWGNSRQLAKMRDDFKKAKQILRTNNSKLHVIAVNGCCYGKDLKPDKGDYFKYCGQKFWEFISGDKDLYLKIIKPLGHKAKEKNNAFISQYAKTINQFTGEFLNYFCKKDGQIDWAKLVSFNSGFGKK